MMTKIKVKRLMPLFISVILVTLLAGPTISLADQPPVNLGTSSSYGVLAGSAITNTGLTTINGDAGGNIGLFPGSAYTGGEFVTQTGAVHINDEAASDAKDDLMAAYLDAVGRTPVTIIPTELGGTTLTPGTYTSEAGKFELTGTLTLDAEGDPDGVFVFITESTLVTASNSSVVLMDEARYCRTFWGVGSSVTLGTNSDFVGHILAMTSITATTGATVQGQLMAIDGAITLDNNTITNGFCETVADEDEDEDDEEEDDRGTTPEPTTGPSATLHVIKHVINDNGGTSDASLFNIHVIDADSDLDVAGSPKGGEASPGTTYLLSPGEYFVRESAFAGDANKTNFANYTASYGGDADTNGRITLVAGDNKTIIITNDDIHVVAIIPPVVLPVTAIPVTTLAFVVSPSETITGGELPPTATPWYTLFLVGALLLLVGVFGLNIKMR